MEQNDFNTTQMDSRERLRTLYLQPGDIIAENYEFVRELGHGGMGMVCLCRDLVANGRLMAVKTVPDLLRNDDEAVAALTREYDNMYSLTNDDIVSVRHLLKDDFRYYIVMDYLEGETLEAYLAKHRKPSKAVVFAVISRIAGALDYAHGKNPPLVHRDVKPENVMVQIDGETVKSVKLMDFGLGIQIRKSFTRVTGEMTSGTPAYKSPEQWPPRRYGKPSCKSDQYSLAAMAYKMLSGDYPFAEYDDNMETFRVAVLNDIPERIDGIEDYVNDALQKALAKKPEDRFATCAAFAEALSGTEPSLVAKPSAAANGQTTATEPSSSGQVMALPQTQKTVVPPQEVAATGPAGQTPPVIKSQSPDTPVVKTPSFVAPSAGKGNLTVILPGDVPLELVHISGRTFTMGCPEAQNCRDVTLTKDYWIGKFPVTQEQYEAMMKQNPSHFKGKDNPVESVAWDEAMQFCQMLNMRLASQLPDGFSFSLPTEAQWECAGRAGTTTGLNNGEKMVVLSDGTSPNLDDLGWYAKNSQNMTHAVGAKLPNAWGLHDMHGNVQEWCFDRYGYGDDYTMKNRCRLLYGEDYTKAMDPTSWFRGNHVLKGGSFATAAAACNIGARAKSAYTDKIKDLGFRVALVPKELLEKKKLEEKELLEKKKLEEKKQKPERDIQRTNYLIEQNKRKTEEILIERQNSVKKLFFWVIVVVIVVIIMGLIGVFAGYYFAHKAGMDFPAVFWAMIMGFLVLVIGSLFLIHWLSEGEPVDSIEYNFKRMGKTKLQLKEQKQELEQLEKQLEQSEKQLETFEKQLKEYEKK